MRFSSPRQFASAAITVLLGALTPPAMADNTGPTKLPLAAQRTIELAVTNLPEMSGLAPSFNFPGVYWAHNDSGDSPRLFAFDLDGNPRGELRISNGLAIDWEDMDSFQNAQGSWLLAADIGDNFAQRPMVEIYLIREPTVLTDKVSSSYERRYSLIYDRGPRDAEAIAVDSLERFVYLLTKRTEHPELYRFSLDALSGSPIPLEFVGTLNSLPSPERHKPQREGSITRFSPTAMSFSPKGDAAIIVTLGKSYLFKRIGQEPWLKALNRQPAILSPAKMPQIEAGGFSADGETILVGSEKLPARVSIFWPD